MSAKLKLKKFRDTKNTPPEKPKLSPDEVKKLFKNWR
jgi:hypothetical protein